MPPVDGGTHVLDYFFEIGPLMSAGFGPGPITHTEINAWQELLGIELSPWEFRLIRRLSLEYLAESTRARKRDCPAPWIEVRAVTTAVQMKEAIAGLLRL